MQLPEIGTYWRHYKSTGGLDHVYEILGISVHSETHEPLVRYKPCYEVPKDSWVYGYRDASRPLSLWYDIIEYNGKTLERFTKLLEPEILSLGLPLGNTHSK